MKFSTNIKTYALGISLILIPSTAKPMHSTAAQRIFSNIKTYALLAKIILMPSTAAQRRFSKFCTSLSWSIAAGPSFYEGAERIQWSLYNEKKYLDQLEDESPEVTQFVHEVLKERGVPNYQTITIKKNPEKAKKPFSYASTSHAILIGQESSWVTTSDGQNFPFDKELSYLNLREPAKLTTYYQNLDENLRQKAWLEKQQLSPDVNQQHVEHALNLCNESLNTHRAIIHHEAVHITNQDLARRAIAHFVIPFLTHGGLKLGVYPIKKLFANRYRADENMLTKGLLKICTAILIKKPVNFLMPYTYCRYQEQRADDYIADDLVLLKSEQNYRKWRHKYSAAISSFIERGNTLHSFIERGNNDERKEQRQKLLNRHPIIANILYAAEDPEHPSPLQRAARLEKRIAKLEQQQNATTQRE